ncbi:MAG: hypothetical protein ABIS84_03330 [Arachnia sp.]
MQRQRMTLTKIRRWASVALLAAVMVAAPIMVAPAHAKSVEPDVYTTPGGHVTNGRYWNTSCEKYASNVVRCRTDIWAFTAQLINGTYQRVEGWVFNNLTYLPSPRENWATNNLGKNTEWTSAEGRKWRTECDTPATGRGGCRSYIWVKQIRHEPIIGGHGQATGYIFTPFEGWVFNNITRFSSSGSPAVSTVPPHVLVQATLGWEGFGPLKIGAEYVPLKDMGYMSTVKGANDCGSFSETQLLRQRGVRINAGMTYRSSPIIEVHLKTPSSATVDGARVGMTIAQVKAIYGARYKVDMVRNYSSDPDGPLFGVDLEVGRVVQDGKDVPFPRELLFTVHEDSAKAITDADKVNRIIMRVINVRGPAPTDQIFTLCNPGDKWEPNGDPGSGD